MEIKNIEECANRIDIDCCDHKRRQYKYLFGFIGLKCFKVVMCFDCNKVQFVGNPFLRFFYPIVKTICRNRFEVIDCIYIDFVDEEGNALDGFCVVCGGRIPYESGKQYCKMCEEKYLQDEDIEDVNFTESES